jgi:hypothetical protein
MQKLLEQNERIDVAMPQVIAASVELGAQVSDRVWHDVHSVFAAQLVGQRGLQWS